LTTGTLAASASSSSVDCANDDRRRIAREHARGVAQRLAATQLQVVRAQHDRQHPEAVRGDLERHPRARGRLVEQVGHGRAVAGGGPPGRPDLHVVGQVEQSRELHGGQVGDPQQIGRRRGSGGSGHTGPLCVDI
jgi:hypothetical protein